MLLRSSFDRLAYTTVHGFHAAASVANLILTTAVIVTQLDEMPISTGNRDGRRLAAAG